MFVFGVKLGFTRKKVRCEPVCAKLFHIHLPKGELNTTNTTERQFCCGLVEFVVFKSVNQLIKVVSIGVNCVGQGSSDHTMVLRILKQDPRTPSPKQFLYDRNPFTFKAPVRRPNRVFNWKEYGAGCHYTKVLR